VKKFFSFIAAAAVLGLAMPQAASAKQHFFTFTNNTNDGIRAFEFRGGRCMNKGPGDLGFLVPRQGQTIHPVHVYVDTSESFKCNFERSFFYMRFVDAVTGKYLEVEFDKAFNRDWIARQWHRDNDFLSYCFSTHNANRVVIINTKQRGC